MVSLLSFRFLFTCDDWYMEQYSRINTLFNVSLNSLNDNKMQGVSGHKTSMQHNTDVIIEGREMADYLRPHSASIWAMYFR